MSRHKRHWRDYRTATGARPVVRFFDGLSDEDYALVLVEMARVRDLGLRAARHLRGQVLLSLDAFAKKSRKTPPAKIALAEKRLRDWRDRGQRRKRNR